MQRMKMTAIVSGAALTTFGLLGCSGEAETPADSAGTSEPADQPNDTPAETPAETPDGDAEGGDDTGSDDAAEGDAGGGDAGGGEAAGGEAAGGEAAGDIEPDDDAPAPGEEPGEVIEGFNGETFSVISTNTLASGVVIDELRIGEGEGCPAGATVVMEYHGTLMDGTVFDSTRGEGARGPWLLANLIKGWQEGVPGMKVGGVRRLTIPYQLAYGPAGSRSIPPAADLTFVIEMVSFGQ